MSPYARDIKLEPNEHGVNKWYKHKIEMNYMCTHVERYVCTCACVSAHARTHDIYNKS